MRARFPEVNRRITSCKPNLRNSEQTPGLLQKGSLVRLCPLQWVCCWGIEVRARVRASDPRERCQAMVSDVAQSLLHLRAHHVAGRRNSRLLTLFAG